MPRKISESGEEICAVCSEVVTIFALGRCDHVVCFRCSTRMRVLCDQMYCAICRADLPKVLFIKDGSRKYNEISTQRFKRNPKYAIHFESEEYENAFYDLQQHACPQCMQRKPYRNFRELQMHMRKEHTLFYCDLCVDHFKLFTYERKFYDRKMLAQHRRVGDPEDKSHKGHPLCKFCEERYLDNDELVRHLRKDHFFCHFCDSDGVSNEFYSEYGLLADHFRECHLLCEEGECSTAQFTNAFRNDIDYRAHIAIVHTKNLRRAQARQARTIEIDVNYASARGQHSRRDRDRDRDRGGVITGSDYEEVNQQSRRGRGGRHNRGRNNQFEADTATAINASLKTQETERQNSFNNEEADFPTLDGRQAKQTLDGRDLEESEDSSENLNGGKSNQSMAKRFAKNCNFSVVEGSMAEEEFPSLGGSGRAAKQTKNSVWAKPAASDFPALGSSNRKEAPRAQPKKQPNKAPAKQSFDLEQDYPSLSSISKSMAPSGPAPISTFGAGFHSGPGSWQAPAAKPQPKPQPARISPEEDYPSLSKTSGKQGRNSSGGWQNQPARSSQQNTRSSPVNHQDDYPSLPQSSNKTESQRSGSRQSSNSGWQTHSSKGQSSQKSKGSKQTSDDMDYPSLSKSAKVEDKNSISMDNNSSSKKNKKQKSVDKKADSAESDSKKCDSDSNQPAKSKNKNKKNKNSKDKDSSKESSKDSLKGASDDSFKGGDKKSVRDEEKGATKAEDEFPEFDIYKPVVSIPAEDVSPPVQEEPVDDWSVLADSPETTWDADFPSLGKPSKKLELTAKSTPVSTFNKPANKPASKSEKSIKHDLEEDYPALGKPAGRPQPSPKKAKKTAPPPALKKEEDFPSLGKIASSMEAKPQWGGAPKRTEDPAPSEGSFVAAKGKGKKKGVDAMYRSLPQKEPVVAVPEPLSDTEDRHATGNKFDVLVEETAVNAVLREKPRKATKAPLQVNNMAEFPSLGALRDQSNLPAKVEDFPSLTGISSSLTVTTPPPGFGAASKAPPGFGGAPKPPPGFSQAVSAPPSHPAESENIAPTPPPVSTPQVYQQPDEFAIRNQCLLASIQSLSDNDDDKFLQFKTCSMQFRQDQLTAAQYYAQCCEVIGQESFLQIFPELLALLPDIPKQQLLLSAHQEATKAAKKAKKGKKTAWAAGDTSFRTCPSCGQVLVDADAESHISTHNLDADFPSLGATSGNNFGMNAWVRAK